MAKVIVLGGGESGVGAARLAQKVGDQVWVSDARQIQAQFQSILKENNIPFEEGGHSIESFFEADVIVKSPGIPGDLPFLQELRGRGIPVISEIEYGFRHTSSKILAITGSNGKTTTTLLVNHLMRTCGESVVVGGNIGASFAGLLADGASPKWFVLEVSSFQLDDIVTFRPDIALLLNITPDHLDRYGGSMDHYAAAKFAIAQNQAAGDVFIYNREDRETVRRLHWIEGKPELRSFGLMGSPAGDAWINQELLALREGRDQYGFPLADLKLLGPHNQLNALAALLAVRAASTCETGIREGLTTFQPIPHRLEPIGQKEGVRFVNDSKATNVEATRYALEAMDGSTIWLAGGVDKGNDYRELQELVDGKVKAVVFLGEYEQEKFRSSFPQTPFYPVNHMKSAVVTALDLAEAGDQVLLSPACASFDLFKNYEDRGDQFRAQVRKLITDT